MLDCRNLRSRHQALLLVDKEHYSTSARHKVTSSSAYQQLDNERRNTTLVSVMVAMAQGLDPHGKKDLAEWALELVMARLCCGQGRWIEGS